MAGYIGNKAVALSTTAADVDGTITSDSLVVDGGTIKLDGNYPTGTGNVALGDTALDSLTSGAYNTAVGHNSGTALTTGGNNTIMGGLQQVALTQLWELLL